MELDVISSDNKFIVYASIGDFRLCTISKLDFDNDGIMKIAHQPLSKGLAVEYKCSEPDERDNYIVIAFVNIDKDGCYDGYRSVGDRIEEYCDNWKKIKTFRTLLTIAEDLINEKEENCEND